MRTVFDDAARGRHGSTMVPVVNVNDGGRAVKEINYTGPRNPSVILLVDALNESIRRGGSTDQIVHQALTDLYNLAGHSLQR